MKQKMKEGDDEDSDSSNVESESLDLDHPEASGVQKSPEISNAPEKQDAEEDYVPGQENVDADQGNLLNFDLSEFFGSEYLSFLDSSEPHQATLSKPSVAIHSGNESGNPPVLTNAAEQQTHSLFTFLPLKRKTLFVNERVNHNKEPKRSWFNVFVLENTALPHPKMQKLLHEATVELNPIHSQQPNTSTPINISEDELTENKGGDTDSPRPIITLSNVSTSPELQTLDPARDIPRSDLSGEARQLFGNRSSDEPERVFQTINPSQGSEETWALHCQILHCPCRPSRKEHLRHL